MLLEQLLHLLQCFSTVIITVVNTFYKSYFFSQIEDYEEEPVLRPGCKEYFWLLCKLIDNIHVKDASQVGFPLQS